MVLWTLQYVLEVLQISLVGLLMLILALLYQAGGLLGEVIMAVLSVIYVTVSGFDIIINNNDDLEWVADLTSGVNMSPNSRLVVGPVDQTYNQSSYQCIFTTFSGTVVSSIGTLTVTGMYVHMYIPYTAKHSRGKTFAVLADF